MYNYNESQYYLFDSRGSKLLPIHSLKWKPNDVLTTRKAIRKGLPSGFVYWSCALRQAPYFNGLEKEQGGQFLAIIFWKCANLLILCRFTDIVFLSFSVKQEYFPPLHIADKNCWRVELSSSVLLQTLAKLKSL